MIWGGTDREDARSFFPSQLADEVEKPYNFLSFDFARASCNIINGSVLGPNRRGDLFHPSWPKGLTHAAVDPGFLWRVAELRKWGQLGPCGPHMAPNSVLQLVILVLSL